MLDNQDGIYSSDFLPPHLTILLLLTYSFDLKLSNNPATITFRLDRICITYDRQLFLSFVFLTVEVKRGVKGG